MRFLTLVTMFGLSAATLAPTGCSPEDNDSGDKSSEEKSSDDDAAVAVVKELITAWQAEDIDAVMKLVATPFFDLEVGAVSEIDEVKSFFEKQFADGDGSKIPDAIGGSWSFAEFKEYVRKPKALEMTTDVIGEDSTLVLIGDFERPVMFAAVRTEGDDAKVVGMLPTKVVDREAMFK